jgi:hydrogenase/urease accessory protein HupE
VAAPVAAAQVTAAHPLGLAEGMAQVILGPEHLGAILALGLLAALRGPDASLRMQIAMPIGLALGALAAGVPLGVVGLDAAALVVTALLGLLAALAWPLPAVLYPLLALVTGTVYGQAAALAQHAVPPPALFAIGVAAAGTLVFALAAWPGLELSAHWQRVALRVLGSWIAAIHLIALGLSLRGG